VNAKTRIGILAGVVALVAGLGASPASALDVTIGNLSGTSFAQGQTYANGMAFTDTFHFDLLAADNSFSAIANQLTMQNFFNIADLSLTLAPPAGPTLTFTPGVDGSIVTNALALPAGLDYVVTLSGLVNGTFGGGYTVLLGAVPFQVLSPVPEPASWAMLLAALVFFAFVGRRSSAR